MLSQPARAGLARGAMIHAVVDIGSNTATMAVFRLDRGGLERLAQEGEPLRLMRRLTPEGIFPASAIERTAQVMRGFARRAADLGASTIDAVATSAVRDARNQEELLRAIREAGVPVRAISGEEEALLAVRSALGTLPMSDGIVVDLGGGSLQLARVRRRRAGAAVSLPLGGLRLSEVLADSDPPAAADLTRLRRQVETALRAIPWLQAEAGDAVVAMGGSVRAMAKVDRRDRRWPIGHDHGYRLDEDALLAEYESLSRMDARTRATVPGLAAHRVDTIVPALVVMLALLRVLRTGELRVSGAGIREGLVLSKAGALRSRGQVRAAALRRHLPALSAEALRGIADGEGDGPTLSLARAVANERGRAGALVERPLYGFWQDELLPAVATLG